MRAIIIDDKDCRALVDMLRLEAMLAASGHKSWADPDKPPTVQEVHRWFHYVVCCWLQEQGGRVT